MTDKLNIYKNIAELCEGLTSFIENELDSTKEQLNISLSGGSTPKTLFDYWSTHCQTRLPWHKIRLFWGDERCVPPSDEMSNYAMTKTHLLDKVAIPTENVFRIKGENNSELEAERYAQILEAELPLEDGIPVFDLILLGLGEDGHTASIFPHQIELWDSTQNCVVATHPQSGMERISITGQVINKGERVVFLATGQAKAQKTKDIIQHRELYLDLYPATHVSPKNHKLYWFLDESASSLL